MASDTQTGRTATRTDVEDLIRVAAKVFNARGMRFPASRVSKIIRRYVNAGSEMASVLSAIASEVGRASGAGSSAYLKALSIECKDNPYVVSYARLVSGGLPGFGNR